MQDLIRAIESTLDTKRTGAQVIARDDHTVLLYHNDFLAQEVLEIVLEQFPDTEIVVQKSDSSRSGYVVQFSIIERQNFWVTSTCMHSVLCTLTLLMLVATGRLDCLLASRQVL